jgi:hypothetical protein
MFRQILFKEHLFSYNPDFGEVGISFAHCLTAVLREYGQTLANLAVSEAASQASLFCPLVAYAV